MGLNPQQLAFKEAYTNPASETFGNALRSALAAGFSESYATDITTADTNWFKEIRADFERLQKAEKVLTKTLEMETAGQPELLRIQTDVAKFIAKGMGRHKYSERVEHTGKDGADLPTPIIKLDVQRNNGDSQNNKPLEED